MDAMLPCKNFYSSIVSAWVHSPHEGQRWVTSLHMVNIIDQIDVEDAFNPATLSTVRISNHHAYLITSPLTHFPYHILPLISFLNPPPFLSLPFIPFFFFNIHQICTIFTHLTFIFSRTWSLCAWPSLSFSLFITRPILSLHHLHITI